MFADVLKRAMERQGISSRELSRRLEVDIHTVSRWTNGISVPSEANISQLARVLSIAEDELRGRHRARRQRSWADRQRADR